ncbi:hypothetical protein Tco_0739587 [Tanacetum coccineum]
MRGISIVQGNSSQHKNKFFKMSSLLLGWTPSVQNSCGSSDPGGVSGYEALDIIYSKLATMDPPRDHHGCTPYKQVIWERACHLPIELEHKAYWALKHANFDLKTAGDQLKVQLNELSVLRD